MGMNMMNVGTKRPREPDQFDSITTMANCLMLLSRAGEFEALNIFHHNNSSDNSHNPSRVFECKTCNRQFPSFQALGGHRASHKKPKLGADLSLQSQVQTSPPKPKTHECSICGQEFAVGQALGGHMRRHRAAMNEEIGYHQSPVSSLSSGQQHQSPVSSLSSGQHEPVVQKSNTSSGRVCCLDLNLTPLENDLEFRLGKVVAPPVDCFLQGC
ncbi:zinc finger protein ZAT11-like [Coffea arabica]|uniref:Zinc finger protein ZAT11-like n=1 Tax=Coffea arabica TaxID=13443 RepID=A0A6P6VEF1_COFAR|nr:zinc finger protein ZAT11-like [Coffea arabica]